MGEVTEFRSGLEAYAGLVRGKPPPEHIVPCRLHVLRLADRVAFALTPA